MAVKLYYFDKSGISEPIQMILAYGGVESEDIYVPTDTIPVVLSPEIKSKCRWGLVPLVEFEGRSLTQSLAATRYFASRCNLIPKDPYHAALCDEFMDSVKDFTYGFSAISHIKNQAERNEKFDKLLKVNKARYLDLFEQIVDANGGLHLVGDDFSWADICLACTFENFEVVFGMDLTEEYPNLRRVKESVLNSPNVKAWREKRIRRA